MRVLIVDDDDKRSDSLCRFLSSNGIAPPEAVTLVGCADQAVRLLQARWFDAVIIDVALPKREGERAQTRWGLWLLGQLRSGRLNKPLKIVGITRHVEDIAQFREKFEGVCAAVIEARSGAKWKRKIAAALQYTAGASLCGSVAGAPISVISVHGIRSFGQWQTRLRSLVEDRTNQVEFHTYRYGYFSSLAFLLPPLRKIEVSRLSERWMHLDLEGKQVFVFCHSFGTYLVVEAARRLIADGRAARSFTLVLSGSVLRSNFDWGGFQAAGVRVINECGARDYVLWLCHALALGLGMAGKVGFNGFNNSTFMNRFYDASHNSYFDGDDFISRYWLPLLTSNDRPLPVDQRSEYGLLHRSIEHVVRLVGTIKPVLYVLTTGGVAWWVVI